MSIFQRLRALIVEPNRLENRLFLANVTTPLRSLERANVLAHYSRIKGTNRTGMTAVLVVVPSGFFVTTIRAWV